MIIYLNGPSSSGKTTLAKALQEALDEPFLHIGIDKAIGLMPKKINNWEGGAAPLGFSWKQQADGTSHIHLGPFAKRITKTYHDIVELLAEQGYNLIIDDVAFGKAQVDMWRESLKDFSVIYIGVYCSLDTLEKREQERTDRMIGSARPQSFSVHEGVDYDLEINTERQSLEESIQIVKSSLSGYGES